MSASCLKIVQSVMTPHERRRLGVFAECDPRTAAAYLNGAVVKQLSAMRIERALRELGRADLIREEAP